MGIKVGVIGLGYMGSAHARIYSGLKSCELVGVCDNDPHKKYLAETYRCSFFERTGDLLKEKLDAVSVCTPTSSHKKVAMEALEQSKNVLIEKPLADTTENGEKILDARKSGVLAVGYIERFNPAIMKLRETADMCDIYSTVSLRFGPYPPRIKDTGVLLDLGSHEIDILRYLTRAQPEVIYAYVSNNLNDDLEDYAFVSLKYGHIHSHVEVSWLPAYKLRMIDLFGNEKFYSLDCAQQKLKYCKAPPKIKMDSGSWQDILWLSRNVSEEIPVSHAEPLALELEAYIASIKKGELIEPLCSAEEALEVLRIVQESSKKKVPK